MTTIKSSREITDANKTSRNWWIVIRKSDGYADMVCAEGITDTLTENCMIEFYPYTNRRMLVFNLNDNTIRTEPMPDTEAELWQPGTFTVLAGPLNYIDAFDQLWDYSKNRAESMEGE